MSRVDERVVRGQKVKLKNLLSPKNNVFGATKSYQKNNLNLKIFVIIFLSFAMSSKLDINIFGNFKVSSLLDTKISRLAYAATSTTATMKLKDLSIGGVINLGAYNYVKIADNQFMQTVVAACPDGKTVAGKYVKCFEDSSDYTQTCTGSYYCNTSNTTWNSSTGKCDSSVTCPDGSTYCGTNAEWSSSASKCVPKSSVCTGSSIWSSASLTCSAPAGSTYCGTNSEWNSTSSTCVGHAASEFCGSGTTYDSTSGTCISCGDHAYVDGGICKCSSGYYADSSGATTAATGGSCSYRKCSGTNVNANTYTNTNSCSCNSGYYAWVFGTGNTPYSKTTTPGGSCPIQFDSSTGYFVYNGANYYLASDGALKTGCTGTMIGGFCWGAASSKEYTWADRDKGCASGYSVPTINQFYALENIMGCSGTYQAQCGNLRPGKWGSGFGIGYWSKSEYDSEYAYYLAIGMNASLGYVQKKADTDYVRCIKD